MFNTYSNKSPFFFPLISPIRHGAEDEIGKNSQERRPDRNFSLPPKNAGQSLRG